MFQEIIARLRESLYRIPPIIYGYLIMGLALWFIGTSAINISRIMPDVISGEEVNFPPIFRR